MNTLHIDMLAALADRTATLVFLLSGWLYGTAAAFASGPEADRYRIVRALAVSLLKMLVPAELQPLLEASPNRSASKPRIVGFKDN